MNKVIEQIRNFGLIPIVVISDLNKVKPLARALLEAEHKIIEITFRTDIAADAIRMLKDEFPQILVGAGTVLTIDNAEKAINSGAMFILSPGFNPRVVDYCLSRNVVIIPGINSPTQIELALEKDLKVLKYFPAEASGGVKLLKSMAAPFKDVHFIPTGGINNSNLASYFTYSRVLACGGSWIAKPSSIASENFNEITNTVAEATKIMLGFSTGFIQLACKTQSDTNKIHKLFCDTLLLPTREEAGCFCLDDIVYFPSKDREGNVNIINIKTLDINRAAYYLKRKGISFYSKNEANSEVLYLDENIAGFQIRIIL